MPREDYERWMSAETQQHYRERMGKGKGNDKGKGEGKDKGQA